MTRSIPIEINTLTAIREACERLSRIELFLAVCHARALRGAKPPNSFFTAFQGRRARVDMIMAEIEETDRYDPETGVVWIDPGGNHRINISEYLK